MQGRRTRCFLSSNPIGKYRQQLAPVVNVAPVVKALSNGERRANRLFNSFIRFAASLVGVPVADAALEEMGQ